MNSIGNNLQYLLVHRGVLCDGSDMKMLSYLQVARQAIIFEEGKGQKRGIVL
jgi:hypothetical protein